MGLATTSSHGPSQQIRCAWYRVVVVVGTCSVVGNGAVFVVDNEYWLTTVVQLGGPVQLGLHVYGWRHGWWRAILFRVVPVLATQVRGAGSVGAPR